MATLNLKGLKKATKKSTAKEYPVVPPTPELTKTVDEFIVKKAKLDALEGDVKTLSASLKEHATAEYFKYAQGKAAPMSSIEIQGTEDRVAVTFVNRYPSGLDEEVITAALGREPKESEFSDSLSVVTRGDKVLPEKRHDFVVGIMKVAKRLGVTSAININIDGMQIPADKRQEFVDQLVELATDLDTVEAIEAKTVYAPTKDFHTARWTGLTADQNAALQTVCAPVTQIKVKKAVAAE